MLSEMKRDKLILIVLILAAVGCGIGIIKAAVPPASTPVDTLQTHTNGTSVVRSDYVYIDGDLYYRGYNVTNAIVGLTVTPTNEFGLVLGTTGDWFNYTRISLNPVYIGLQMHPTNITYDEVLVLPVVYDKDATHWQLALYWVNGTQITDNTDLRVMYIAHVDINDPEGDDEILPNAPD